MRIVKLFTVEQRRRLLEEELFIYTPDEFAILMREKSPFIMEIVKEGKVLYEKGN